MAILAPLLADSLQSFFVLNGGIRLYQAIFSLYLASPEGLCVFVGMRAIITFLILWFFVRIGFRDRTVWICLAVLWLFVDYMLESAVIK